MQAGYGGGGLDKRNNAWSDIQMFSGQINKKG